MSTNQLFAFTGPLADNLEGLSAAFSSWFVYAPARVILDAGEGIASCLGNRVFLPESVLLTHAHYDHISGLAGFLLARTNARGDTEKPVDVYYPKAGEDAFRSIHEYVNQVVRYRSYVLEWKPVCYGEQFSLRKWTVEPLATRHNVPSCGYRFLEDRSRLKPEYRNCTPPEIISFRDRGTEITERFQHVVLAFTGDTGPGLAPALFQNADVLIHEATFLRGEDREGLWHSTAEEALTLAVKASVKVLILYHISQRYQRQEIEEVVTAL
jgi:ribonuclease Z